MSIRLRTRLAALTAGLLLSGATALAQSDPSAADPAAWLRQVYDLYHRAEAAPALQASDRLIRRRASKAFAALFARNAACETRGEGVCALDWDFVIDGQDYALSNVTVGPLVVAGEHATVTVKFRDFDTDCVNVYAFVREGGMWKVDDVETRHGSDAPVRIAELLKAYDFSK